LFVANSLDNNYLCLDENRSVDTNTQHDAINNIEDSDVTQNIIKCEKVPNIPKAPKTATIPSFRTSRKTLYPLSASNLTKQLNSSSHIQESTSSKKGNIKIIFCKF